MTKKKIKIVIKRLRRELNLSESFDHRYLDCPNYDYCLRKVSIKDWESFSCNKCPIFIKHLKEKNGRKNKKLLGKKSKNLWIIG